MSKQSNYTPDGPLGVPSEGVCIFIAGFRDGKEVPAAAFLIRDLKEAEEFAATVREMIANPEPAP